MKNAAIMFIAGLFVVTSLTACGTTQDRQLAEREQQMEDQADKQKEQIEERAEQQKEQIEQKAEQQKEQIDKKVEAEKEKIDAMEKKDDKSGGIFGGKETEKETDKDKQ